MTYFKNVTTLEELRRQYKELLKIHHPDNGGNVSDMQQINAEYDRLFKVLKDKHESKQAMAAPVIQHITIICTIGKMTKHYVMY